MKSIALLVIIGLFVLALSSCHMNEKCPAYADNSQATEQSV